MGVAVGLILAAFGAILIWAVDAEVSGLNVTAVGVILLIVGILVLLLDIFWWRSWTWYAAGPARSRRTYVRDTAAPVEPVQPVQPAAGRRVVVDEEIGGPPAGPPPP
jgi:membrane protein YdbS with pleckstrin-like domain